MSVPFITLHRQVLQERQLTNLLSTEINRQRDFIETSLRGLISELRSFALCDMWYPKLSETDVTTFINSSIYKRDISQIFETPSSLPFSTSITVKINNFMKGIPQYYPLLIKCIFKYFTDSSLTNRPNLNYIPSPSILFFASSTFPSLFGYCWCIEQGVAYVHALCELIDMQIKSCGSVTSAHFRNSFIRELIRQFLHNDGIQKYLQLALSSDLSIIMNDEVLTSMQESSLEYIEILLKYAVKLTNELIYCIPKIPSIIRYFFSEAFKVALRNFPEQTSEAYQLMEYFFINIILQPAMLNPKLFCLVTETAAITRSNHFTTLTKLFRWKLNHKLIPEMYIEKGILCNDTFKQLRVFEILEKIGIYDGGVEGISAKKLQKVTKVMSHPLLLSVNDILYLTQLVNDTINLIEVDSSEKAARYKFKELCNIGNVTLENDELLDFWFQSFKLPTNNMTNINDDEEEGAKIVLPIINKISNNNNGEESKEIEQLIVHLINYLQGIHPDPNAPTNLTKFLQKQMEKAEDISSNEWITRTQAIQSKIKRSHKSDDEILKILHNTINKRIFEHSSKFSISFKLQERGQELEMLYQNAKNANLQLKPIVYQAVLKLFLLRNDLVEKDIGSNILALMVKDQDWLSFFSSTADSLFKFAEQIGLDSSSNMALARQLHSGLVSKLPMKNFMIVNRELMQKNNQVVDLTDKAMALFMKETHSQNLTKLFENPNCFEPVYRILRNGTITGAPLERLAYICDAMTALQNIYLFETGEACAGDDFLPLVIYTLLGAKLPNLATLVKYISHYLFAITEKLRVLESKEKYVATTFVSAADHIFALIENLQKKINKSNSISVTSAKIIKSLQNFLF